MQQAPAVPATGASSTSRNKGSFTSWIVLGVGILAVSTASVLIRLSAAPSLVVGAYRMVLAAVVLTPWAWPRARRELRGFSRREWLYLILSGTALALHFAAWITSLSLTTVSSSVVLATTNPIYVGLVSHFLLHERVSPRTAIAIAVAVAGSVIVGMGDVSLSGRALLGDALALLSAMAISAHFLLGRVLRRRLSTLAYVWPCYGIAGIVLLSLCLISGQPLTGYAPQTYLYLVALALVPQVIPDAEPAFRQGRGREFGCSISRPRIRGPIFHLRSPKRRFWHCSQVSLAT